MLLRLGRYDEAIAGYDKALVKKPEESISLYGRTVAEARKGLADKAEADRLAAMRFDPNVADTFAGYGITL